jgi:uncharacterized membrane-anchored protein
MTTTLLVNIALSSLAFVLIVGAIAALIVTQDRNLSVASLTTSRRRSRVTRAHRAEPDSRLAVEA